MQSHDRQEARLPPLSGAEGAQSDNEACERTEGTYGGESVTIELPLPPDILRPNRIGGANKYAVTRARREARAMACHLACQAWHDQPITPQLGGTPLWSPCPVWTRVRATATFSGVSKNMDGTNGYAWLKATVDGIADALCGGSDHLWQWQGEPVFARGEKGLVIVVWPVAEEREGDVRWQSQQHR